MKRKKLFFFCTITFCCFSVFSNPQKQELPDYEQKQAGQNKVLQSERTKTERPERPVIKSEPQNNDSETSAQKENFFIRTYKTFSSLPLYFDLGCEPQLNGNKIYGSLEYDWSRKYISFLGTSYATKLDSKTQDFGNTESKQTNLEINFKPYLIRFANRKNPQKQITFEPGFLMLYEIDDLITNTISDYIKENQSKSNGLLQTEYFVKSFNYIPYISTKMKFPLGKYISLNNDFLFSPIYYNVTKNTTNVKFTDVAQVPLAKPTVSESSVEYRGISTPYTTANVYVNFFNLFALVSGVTYKRTTYRSEETDYISTINLIKWRTGLSLLNLGKTELRFKTGIFYEYTWNIYEDTDELNTKAGSLIIGVNAYISN